MARDTGLLIRRVERFLPFVAAAVLVAGLLVFFLNRGGGRGAGAAAPATRVPVDPKAVAAARAFIRDAVRRQDLARAYEEVAPELRRGYTRAEWSRGSIPVVPYPGRHVRVAPFFAKISVPGRATLVVELAGAGAPTSFRIGLEKRGDRWLVTEWAPSGALRPGG